jgi:hypothetical protein
MTSIIAAKTSYRSRMVIRLRSKNTDLVLDWSTPLHVKKVAREEAVRRAMIQISNSKKVSFEDNKENSRCITANLVRRIA